MLPSPPPTLSVSIGLIKTAVAKRPNDVQGQTLLAQKEARVVNFSAAADAQSAVVRLKGPDATTEEVVNYGELMIMAAGGMCRPKPKLSCAPF